MGYNTSVLVLNDALHRIEDDVEFGKKISRAAQEVMIRSEPIEIRSGNHMNAATVIETHHADMTAVLAVGQNYGQVLTTSAVWPRDHDSKVAILKQLAHELGYNIRKKSK